MRRRRQPLAIGLLLPPRRALDRRVRWLLEWYEFQQWLRRPQLIGFVTGQSSHADAGSVNSGTLAFPSNTSAGDTIFAVIRLGGATATVTVADNVNAGNYTQDFHQTDSTNGEQLWLFRKTGIAAGATTLTATISGGPATLRWCIGEYTFGGANAVLDQTAFQLVTTNGNTIDSTATPTTTNPNELCLGFCMTAGPIAGGISAGTGYALRDHAGSGGDRVAFEDKVVAATGAYNATFSTGSTNDAGRMGAICTYYAAAARTTPLLLLQALKRAANY